MFTKLKWKFVKNGNFYCSASSSKTKRDIGMLTYMATNALLTLVGCMTGPTIVGVFSKLFIVKYYDQEVKTITNKDRILASVDEDEDNDYDEKEERG